MPTSTFYNLPEDKKNRVINAAIDEFIRVENGEVIKIGRASCRERV